MSHRWLAGLCLSILATAGLAAAEFWETKPFLEWSDKEAEKLMTGSPWAAVIGTALPPPLPVASDGGGGGGRGGGDDNSFGPGPRRIQVGLSWRSALPVRQALVRAQVGQRGSLTADQQAFLAREGPYVIAVSSLPAQYSRGQIEAFLRRKGKPPIPVAEAASQKTATGPVLLIGFLRTDPIVLEDGDVEFTFKADRFELKKKFTLKNMVFGGKLEL